MSNLLLISMSLLVLMILRTLVAVVNAAGKPFLPVAKCKPGGKVSILIPARNEEENLPRLLNSILRLDYPEVEVWVCDDHSSDHTWQILKEWKAKDPRIGYFQGEPLPPSWSGKNYACHQLAKKATGDYLLFVDADVTLASHSLEKALAFFNSRQLALLTIFPRQLMQSNAERITVPFMNWALLNLLPLLAVLKLKNPLFAAGNGQFMLFDALHYRKNCWHKKVKASYVEDILIVRMVKEQGHRVAVLLGNNDVFCRMYQSYRGSLQGFSRNVHEFFLGSRILMILFWISLLATPVALFLSWSWVGLLVYLGLFIINRLAVSGASCEKLGASLLLHPLNILFFTHLIYANLGLRIKKNGQWKNRTLAG